MYITTFFIKNGSPITGLNPSITVIKISDNSIIVNAAAMSEISNGLYKYNFTTYDSTIQYLFFIDGGSSVTGNERYKTTSNMDDVQISSKLPAGVIMSLADYTAPDNTSITAIKTKTDNLPNDPASETNATSNANSIIASIPAAPDLSSLALEATAQAIKTKTNNLPTDPASNTQVNTRLAASGYTAPDNAGITSINGKVDLIKAKTDLIPASPAQEGTLTTIDTIVDAIKAKTDNLPADPTSETVALANAGTIISAIPADIASETNATSNKNAIIAAIPAAITGFALETTAQSIKSKTDLIPADPTSETNATSNKNEILANVPEIDLTGIALESSVQAVKSKTDLIPVDPATETTVNTRLPTSSYVAPNNSGITAIKAKTDNLPADPASNTQVNTRLASSNYVAPDNSGITAIKERTDNLPDDPTSEANATSNKYSIIAAIPSVSGLALESTLQLIKAKTDNMPADISLELTEIDTKLLALDTINTQLARLLGLTHENIYQRHTFSNGNTHTGSVIEIYDSKAHTQLHDGTTGLVAKYTLTITNSATGIPQSHMMVKD